MYLRDGFGSNISLWPVSFSPVVVSSRWNRRSGKATDLSCFRDYVDTVHLLRSIYSQSVYTDHFEIISAVQTIRFFKRSGAAPAFELSLRSVDRLEVIEEWYRPSRGRQLENYVLCAFCNDGQRVDLSISTDERLIRELVSAIEDAK